MSERNIIDIWCNLFTEEGFGEFHESQAGAVAAQLFNRDDMYAPENAKTPSEYVEYMDEHSVEQTFLAALKFGNPDGGLEMDIPYEGVREVCEAFPDRFRGLAGINPREGMDGVAKLEQYVRQHGFVGAILEPYGWNLPINHRQYYPFYAKCAELGVPVVMQVGHSAIKMPSRMGKPILLDDIALDFPDLDIVGSHTGWPWSAELEAMAWKHPNVYIGTTAHAPKYWDENIVQFIRSRGQDKVMFGTDFPVVEYGEALNQLDQMDFPPEVERKLLGDNARRVFDV